MGANGLVLGDVPEGIHLFGHDALIIRRLIGKRDSNFRIQDGRLVVVIHSTDEVSGVEF
jgi:hypothetical protein